MPASAAFTLRSMQSRSRSPTWPPTRSTQTAADAATDDAAIPQSVAILCFDGGRAGDFLLRDALALLTQQGCVAVAIRHVDDGGMAEDKLLSLMEILTHHPSYANLPILLFGNGRGVVAARALLLRLPPERLSRSALLAPAELLLKRDASTGREMDFEIERTKGYYPDFDEWRYFLDCARENDEEHP